MALTKEEAVLGLVLEMLGVEEREDDSVELEVLESIPLFKEYRRKIDWPQFTEKIKQDEAEREDCINALKSASKDIQLDALCLANIAMVADGKMDDSEVDLMAEVSLSLGFGVEVIKEVSDRSKEMLGLEEERKESEEIETVDSFKNKIVELWTKSVDEELEYSGLIKYCDKFFDTGYGILSRDRKKTKWIYYKDRIDFKKFHKQFTEGKDNYLNEFDLENEIVLFYYDNDGWADHNVMLFTNKNLYYWLSKGKGITDIGETNGIVPIDHILKGKVEIKGWANHEICLNGETLGGIDLIKDTKKVLEDFFDHMPSEEIERIENERI